MSAIPDRLAPALHASGHALMHQRWHELLFLHWEVDAQALAKLLPRGLEVDTYEGRAYVGLVAFTMTGVRPRFAPPVPLVSSFHETNVRAYVRAVGGEPGVWFFSLEAASRVAVVAARAGFHLPYHFARMSLRSEGHGDARRLDYESDRVWPGPLPARSNLRGGPRGPVREAQPGTLEHFLVERYVLYAARGERLYRGRVSHHAYPLQDAVCERWDESLVAAAGITRADIAPIAHFAAGVDVLVTGLQRV